jgi:hypothetical protein
MDNRSRRRRCGCYTLPRGIREVFRCSIGAIATWWRGCGCGSRRQQWVGIVNRGLLDASTRGTSDGCRRERAISLRVHCGTMMASGKGATANSDLRSTSKLALAHDLHHLNVALCCYGSSSWAPRSNLPPHLATSTITFEFHGSCSI